MRRLTLFGLGGLGLGMGLGLGLAGCVGSPEASRAPAPAAPSRVTAAYDSDGTAVAVALVFPGSAWELPGLEGLTLLTAETLLEQARAPLQRMGAHARVDCGRAAFTFTLISTVEVWEPALDTLLRVLFRPRPDSAALETARARLSRSLSLDLANPAWQARLAVRQALHGDTIAPTPWSGPACGVPELLPFLRLDQVRAASLRFSPRLAHAALVGPIDADVAAGRLRARIPDALTPDLPAPRQAAPGRRYVERNTVTAWTGLAFPFDEDTDVRPLVGVAALIEDAFGPSVDRPEVFALGHEVERHGGGGALIIHLVTTPAAAARYGDAVEAAVRAIGAEGVPEAAWLRLARRERGRQLLAMEAPESRAAELALRTALRQPPGDGWDGTSLSRAAVQGAAEKLGRASRSVVGPREARPGPP